MKHLTFALFVMLLNGLVFMGSCDKNDSLLDDQMNDVGKITEAFLKIGFVETPDLTEVEIEMIQYMKEEEKLARDVYYALYDTWGSQIFSNISSAEENHLAAVLRLIGFYDLPDSTVGAPGEFESDFFKNLYDELVTQGSESLVEAYKVGGLIEEMDIKDLDTDMELTTNENMILVFSSLLSGSEDHLIAFTSKLEQLGVTYVPQYLSQEAFDAVINSIDEGRSGTGTGNGDGICDSLGDGSGPGDGDGVCDSLGYGNGHGGGDGECDSLGYGYGDGDGICDSLGYGDGDGDGVCDSIGDGNQHRSRD